MNIRKPPQQYPPPYLHFPVIAGQEYYVSPKLAETFEFYALSDGLKRVYTEKDALTGYGTQKILAPWTVSYFNLFINGVLQPKSCYHIENGKITILTVDIPINHSPIILQMVKI